MFRYASPIVLAVLGACSSSTAVGQGQVDVVTYGEDYIEKEIPADQFEDGWSVKYTKFLVVITEFTAADDKGAVGGKVAGSKLFDMHAPGRKPVASLPGLEAKAYNRVSFSVVPATAATELGQGATEADKQLMLAGGLSVYVAGSATKGAVTKSFEWGMKTATLYDRCKAEEGGKEVEGLVVATGATENVELTIHGDHFFYDDLQSPDAKLRFDNLAAADSDNDGKITLEELSKVQLAALPSANGPYGTGGAAGVNDLRAFVEGLSRTLGHFRGEGECVATPR
jgi:hypothetical protein